MPAASRQGVGRALFIFQWRFSFGDVDANMTPQQAGGVILPFPLPVRHSPPLLGSGRRARGGLSLPFC